MDNKKTLWVVLGLVVLVGVIWAIVMVSNSNQAQPVIDTNTTTKTRTTTPTPAATVPSSSNLSYNAALLKYGTNRIQFQPDCQAVPDNMVFKNGVTIMLDNRAAVSRVVKLDKSYTLGAYSFTTATLSSSQLPHKILVDCGKSQNVATITVEK